MLWHHRTQQEEKEQQTMMMTHLICEQGGEEKIGKVEVRVRMCHARQKKADF